MFDINSFILRKSGFNQTVLTISASFGTFLGASFGTFIVTERLLGSF